MTRRPHRRPIPAPAPVAALVVVVVLVAAFVVASSLGLGTAGAAAGSGCTPPRCVDAAVPVPAALTVPDGRVRILLPEGYAADACRRWPVLYLLHGVGDTWESWFTNAGVEEFTRGFAVIIVMPDAGRTPDAGWYSDWLDGSRQWERFHIGTLVPWVDATFRTLSDRGRMVAGFSMGGFGAMSYAARHRGTFDAAASFSGLLDTMYGYPASGPGFANASAYAGTPDQRVWGDQVRDEAVWRDHNPTDRAADLRDTALYIYAGTGAAGGAAGDNPEKSGNYAVENLIFQTNLSFTRALDAAGVPYESDFHAGYHDWPYFEAGLRWALPKMLEGITPDASSCAVPARPAGSAPPRGELPATGTGPDGRAAAVVLLAAFGLALVRARIRL